MLPTYSSSGSKVVPRHHAGGYAASNGYPRNKDFKFDISPHRFQPRGTTPINRRRRRLLIRIGIILAVALLFGFFIWPGGGGTVASIFSLGLLSTGDDFQLETVRYYDLSNVQGTARGWEREERILLCVPLREAEAHLPMFFSHLHNFTYPHHLIDLAFLVSDSTDRTLDVLIEGLESLQASEDVGMPYGEVSIIEKDFGQKVNQDAESRHGFAAQASRRKLMAQARNWLLTAALRPYHSWVYWRDVDVETAPFTILEDLMRHNKDVIVPNVWRPLPEWLGGEQPYDLNSWQESETALALADTLDEDAVIVEGYAEYATWRPHLAYLRDPYGDPDMEMEIDGVGGVSILAKARVFRYGVHFPAFSFEKHAETEGFGKMARLMDFSVVGLPHYTIWHLYEPSVDDIKRMEASLADSRIQMTAANSTCRKWRRRSNQWERDKEAASSMAKDKQRQGADSAQQPRKSVKPAREVEEIPHVDDT
ncbi:hypothetical protein VSDG_00300 [Cytospora chrysosperma]|uniref:Mannan polymerase II complex ANP1 subunit n=1 Tax=Cytospora chrysosperma TaxID=252740 RepID=A0A423WQ60_CYTCH|nr:hypothetical protein VSDG_00300 [Valsa sordida]